MASFAYTRFAADNMRALVDLDADTLKLVLVNSTYVPLRSEDAADEGGADDMVDGEIGSVTNYTGGYSGAGRKTLSSVTVTEDDANDRGELDAADVTWSSLGGAANDTIVAAVLVKEDHINTGGTDTGTLLICHIDIADTLTNGSDFTIQWDAEGILQLSTA